MNQTKLFSGQALTMVMSAPDQGPFKRPMSHGARDTLSRMLEWSIKFTPLFNTNPKQLMTEFVSGFSQVKYEAAEQAYDTVEFMKIVQGVPGTKSKPGLKPKTKHEVLSIMWMDKLLEGNWAHENPIPRRNRNADILQVQDVYNWLVDNYLSNDITIYDLNKIAEMGRSCRHEIVKREAAQIADPDKRTIPYLYAVVRSITSRDEIAQYRNSIADRANVDKLAALGALAAEATDKRVHEFEPDLKEKWEREREFARLCREFSID